MRVKQLTVIGCVAWIAGLVVSIVGLNLSGSMGSWLSIIGNIVFFAGLFCVGGAWLMRHKASEKKDGGS